MMTGKLNIFKKLYHKLRLIHQQEFGFADLGIEPASHLLNFTQLQRASRRKTCPIAKPACGPVFLEDEKYKHFLLKHSFVLRRSSGQKTLVFPAHLSANCFYYAASFKDEIIGGVGLCCRDQKLGMKFWLISGLVVLRSFQGRGIGEKLVQAVCSQLPVGDNLVYLSVDPDNFRAQNLYKKLGFRQDADWSEIILQNENQASPPCGQIFLFKKYIIPAG